MQTAGVETLVDTEGPSLTTRIASAVRSRSDGMSRAILFGSVARGEERPGSDVDLLLVWSDDSDEDARWDVAMRIAKNVDDDTGMVCIPLVYADSECEQLSSGLAASISRDGVDLLSHAL
ncbi:MAG: nucleotidyltransferase domain-containing protein [bacterium]|nr:nucleotidyltransferase domain-containing protein [bacterium]